MAACLSCKDLHVSFRMHEGDAKAVRGVSFDVHEQKTLGIVGESGCGKSVTAMSIMRLIPNPPGQITGGTIHFEGRDLLRLKEIELRRIRGARIGMIFQDPMSSLNPVYTCGYQIREVLQQHMNMGTAQADQVTERVLGEVGIAHPSQTAKNYPHQLSGGMRQRVMIAMSLACSPTLLIADEPTTALDVTVQARILDLLHEIQAAKKMSLVLITHNLGIVGDIAHDVMVMYAGEVMEMAPVRELFDNPMHPYTTSLIDTIPYVTSRKERLTVIPGEVPTPQDIPPGCPFNPRCKRAFDRCTKEHPALIDSGNGHNVRCFLYE